MPGTQSALYPSFRAFRIKKSCKELFDQSVGLQKQFFRGDISIGDRDKALSEIQELADNFVLGLYGFKN